jgi:hypothetical protein
LTLTDLPLPRLSVLLLPWLSVLSLSRLLLLSRWLSILPLL